MLSYSFTHRMLKRIGHGSYQKKAFGGSAGAPGDAITIGWFARSPLGWQDHFAGGDQLTLRKS